MPNQKETVLITGASTGIGFAVARAFLDRGCNLVPNSREPRGRYASRHHIRSTQVGCVTIP